MSTFKTKISRELAAESGEHVAPSGRVMRIGDQSIRRPLISQACQPFQESSMGNRMIPQKVGHHEPA